MKAWLTSQVWKKVVEVQHQQGVPRKDCYKKPDVKLVIDAFLGALLTELVSEKRVSLNSFGTFSLKTSTGGAVWNPIEQKMIKKSGTRVRISFKPSRRLKEVALYILKEENDGQVRR